MIRTLLTLSLIGAAPLVFAGDAPAAPSEEKLARGLLLQHEGRLIFSPCRERSYVTVKDVSPGAAVTSTLAELGLKPGKNLYVEFYGTTDGDQLAASAINFARTDAQCQLPGGDSEAWRAAGNNPPWSLVTGGGSLRVIRQDKPDLNLAKVEIKAGDKLVEIASPERPGVTVRFQRQACRDQAKAMAFGWTVRLTVDGATLQGCGWQR